MQSRPWPQVPELTAQVARSVAARGPYPLAMRVRDELGELFPDTEFAEAFAERGRPGWSPGQLALVTVLQFVENLTDRAAAHRVRYGMDFKYALVRHEAPLFPGGGERPPPLVCRSRLAKLRAA